MTIVKDEPKKFTPFRVKNKFSLILRDVILDLLEGINTARALALAISYRYENTVADYLLVSDPLGYTDARSYQLDAQAIALFKKSVYMPYDSKMRALEAELSFLSVDGEIPRTVADLPISEDAGFVFDCRRIISAILGEVPHETTLKLSFTSGSEAGYKLSESTIADKLSRPIGISPTAVPYFREFCKAHPKLFDVMAHYGLNIMRNAYTDAENAQVFQVVPKQYNKDRTIVKTFFGDMILQRAFALHIRKRLRKIGIDLEDAQDVHKCVLRHNADAWATIDLSDASDRISDSLCRLLLPNDWYWKLKKIKSDTVKMTDGSTYSLNKFCCQGNGYTFELETLLFYAISMTAMRRAGQKPIAFVYGDDTIVPVASGSTVMKAYELCGLKVNNTKSFLDCPFKESCGFDIYQGVEVRSVYLKDFKAQENKAYAYIKLANRIYEIAKKLFGDICNCGPFNRARFRILNLFKDKYRFECPESAGDVAFIATEPRLFIDRERQLTYYKGYRKRYSKDELVQPAGVPASEWAYILTGNSSDGSLIRGAKFELIPCRMFGFFPQPRDLFWDCWVDTA